MKKIFYLLLLSSMLCSSCSSLMVYRDGRKGVDAHEIAVNVMYYVAIGQALSLAHDSLTRED